MHTLEQRTQHASAFALPGRSRPGNHVPPARFDRALFSEVLDSIDEAYVAFEANGAVVCRNHAFEQLGDDEHQLEHEGRRLALSYAHSGEITHSRVREFATAGASYRMRVTHVGSSADHSRLVLVAYERGAPARPALAAHYRLTPRELKVAQLVAEGHTNSSVAAALGVSTHTVRHHVARLLAKLGAARRGEIAARFWKR